MKELFNDADFSYCLSKEFKNEFLIPVGKYVLWKLLNGWDDYNELYHASSLMEKVLANKELWMESHLMIKAQELKGVGFIIGGNIKNIESRTKIYEERKSLLFKYFHIIERGKGYGQKWLQKIILPYYKNLGYHSVYISSSHIQSYPLYARLGSCIEEYSVLSDNKIYKREGKIFEVDLEKVA